MSTWGAQSISYGYVRRWHLYELCMHSKLFLSLFHLTLCFLSLPLPFAHPCWLTNIFTFCFVLIVEVFLIIIQYNLQHNDNTDGLFFVILWRKIFIETSKNKGKNFGLKEGKHLLKIGKKIRTKKIKEKNKKKGEIKIELIMIIK